MNDLTLLLEPSGVYRLNGLLNKKKLFEKLAEELSSGSGLTFHRVLDGLTAREKLGSTCIGKGVAIPHCKLSVDMPKAVIIILDEAIKYTEDDCQNVDIVFGLLVPSDQCEQHLHILSSIARLCDRDSWLNGLRELESEEAIVRYILAPEINQSQVS